MKGIVNSTGRLDRRKNRLYASFNTLSVFSGKDSRAYFPGSESPVFGIVYCGQVAK